MLANPLTTDVEVPGQTLGRLTADDLVERVIFVVGYRNADFDGPTIRRHMGGHFRL